MKEPVMTKILGWVFDQVMTRPIRRFEEANNRPFASQEQSLRRILRANATTEFGRAAAFPDIAARSSGTEMWKAFRKTVPVRSYADFLPQIERMKYGEADVLVPGRPCMFSLTSGTTSEPKFCPVTREFIREHHRQHLLWMYRVYRDHPGVNQGKYLVVASPAEIGRTAGGIPYGAMSGKQLDSQSVPVRRRMAVPAPVQRLPSAEDRWFRTLLFALAEENLRLVVSVNPSTLVSLADRLDRDAEALIGAVRTAGHPARAKRLSEIYNADGCLTPSAVWPHLQLLLTWQGGSSAFYLPHVETLWGNIPRRCLGLRASEGTFSIPLRDRDPSGVLAVGGHVMEFVPADAGDPAGFPDTLLPGQLEEGGLYRLIVTTSGGFYRYDMGDLVKVTGFRGRTPEVAFRRRAGAVLSATGEKVTEDQALGAMTAASAAGPLLTGFTVTWELENGVARYVIAMECAGCDEIHSSRYKLLKERIRQLVAVFDDELMHRNCEYQAKRDDGRLAYPRAVMLAQGSYERLRAARAAEGRPENQIKQPLLVTPPAPGRMPVAGCPVFDNMEIAAEL